MMKDVGLDDAMQELAANETKLAINRSCCATSEVPDMRFVMGERRVGMLEEGDGDFRHGQYRKIIIKLSYPENAYLANGLPIGTGGSTRQPDWPIHNSSQ